MIKLITYITAGQQGVAAAIESLEDRDPAKPFALGPAAVDAAQDLSRRFTLSYAHGKELLSTVYESGAVIDRRPQTPIVRFDGEYIDSVEPGARVPHLWLERDGQGSALIDYLGKSFILLAREDDTHWAFLPEHNPANPALVQTIVIGGQSSFQTTDPKWSGVYALGPGEVVLIRPDGHIAARLSATDEATARLLLSKSLAQILWH